MLDFIKANISDILKLRVKYYLADTRKPHAKVIKVAKYNYKSFGKSLY